MPRTAIKAIHPGVQISDWVQNRFYRCSQHRLRRHSTVADGYQEKAKRPNGISTKVQSASAATNRILNSKPVTLAFAPASGRFQVQDGTRSGKERAKQSNPASCTVSPHEYELATCHRIQTFMVKGLIRIQG